MGLTRKRNLLHRQALYVLHAAVVVAVVRLLDAKKYEFVRDLTERTLKEVNQDSAR